MSDLLNSASLVLIPSGYKEDIVYSAIPTDGSGDLSFTRASNGTRVNSAGLVEVVPWNLLEQSNSFNTTWLKNNVTLTSGQTDKDGNANAWKVEFTGGANDSYLFQQLPVGQKTGAVWVKGTVGQTAYIGIRSSVASGDLITFTGNWQQILETTTDNYFVFSNYGAGTATTFFIQNAQANIGATLKPYFPTTDRLNVPRLTYQNGGGGCPSLLLEKQSTNLFAQSNTFTSVGDWYIYKDSGSTFTQTSNYGISPDGTQNATRLQASITAGVYANYARYFTVTISTTYTYSIYIKSLSGTPTIRFVTPNGSAQSVTLTTNWERYTYTFTASSADFYGNFYIESPTSSSYDLLTYGAQLEASSYPTSYIPTTSASATRVADACFKTGISSLIGASAGTLFLYADIQKHNDADFYIAISDGSSLGEAIYMYQPSSGTLDVLVRKAGNTVALSVLNANWTAGLNKVAIAYTATTIEMFINGVSKGSTTFTALPTLSQLTIGSRPDSVGNLVGTGIYSEAVVFPTRLTDSECIALTTI